MEMITGVPAFSGDTPVAKWPSSRYARVSEARPREIMPQLSAPIDAAIMKCLQKDSAKRFQSVDELEIAHHRRPPKPSGSAPGRFRLIEGWSVQRSRSVRVCVKEPRTHIIL